MFVRVLEERGYLVALFGLGLNRNITSDISFSDFISDSEKISKMEKVAANLCNLDGGHNKFLESIAIWIDVKAPRYWWQQFDTYRVGMTKQSESTMRVPKRKLSNDDFITNIDPTILECLNRGIEEKNLTYIKMNLPESFLQRRVCCTNYKCLRNMIMQRSSHLLEEWRFFVAEIKNQCQYPHLLPEIKKETNE